MNSSQQSLANQLPPSLNKAKTARGIIVASQYFNISMDKEKRISAFSGNIALNDVAEDVKPPVVYESITLSRKIALSPQK